MAVAYSMLTSIYHVLRSGPPYLATSGTACRLRPSRTLPPPGLRGALAEKRRRALHLRLLRRPPEPAPIAHP
jgi:hypothetical protein